MGSNSSDETKITTIGIQGIPSSSSTILSPNSENK